MLVFVYIYNVCTHVYVPYYNKFEQYSRISYITVWKLYNC